MSKGILEAQFQGSTKIKTSYLVISFVLIFSLLTSPNKMYFFLSSLESVLLTGNWLILSMAFLLACMHEMNPISTHVTYEKKSMLRLLNVVQLYICGSRAKKKLYHKTSILLIELNFPFPNLYVDHLRITNVNSGLLRTFNKTWIRQAICCLS